MWHRAAVRRWAAVRAAPVRLQVRWATPPTATGLPPAAPSHAEAYALPLLQAAVSPLLRVAPALRTAWAAVRREAVPSVAVPVPAVRSAEAVPARAVPSAVAATPLAVAVHSAEAVTLLAVATPSAEAVTVAVATEAAVMAEAADKQPYIHQR